MEARTRLVPPPGTLQTPAQRRPDTRQTVLFSSGAETCSQLREDRFASLAAAAAYYCGRDPATSDLVLLALDQPQRREPLTANTSPPRVEEQLEAACGQGYADPRCRQVFQSRRTWAQMVLGVQFTSFPQLQIDPVFQ